MAVEQALQSPIVLVIDFGAQYAQLIARRVRQAGIYSEIAPHSISAIDLVKKNPVAIILSGGPASVYVEAAPKLDADIFKLGIPIFGICYGFQLLALSLIHISEPTRQVR
jgi:GMP synthase (glutamine-hydrolysing)